MTESELMQYILNRKYYCPFCIELQWRVVKLGLEEINNWDGMICGGVEDMQNKLEEIKHEKRD